jgi:glycosyltransferase involved in cell wall biosynthesis
MNVCIIRHSYYPEIPPTKRNAEALVSHGYKVDIICLRKKGQKSQEIINGVTVHRLPIEHLREGKLRYVYEYTFFFILAALKLNQLFLKRKFKVVEIDGMPDFLVFTTLPIRLMGTRVIYNMLDSVSEVFSDRFKAKSNSIMMRIFKTVEKASTGYVDYLLFANYLAREYHINYRGVNGSKTSVVMNVPDEEMFHPRNPNQESQKTSQFQIINHGSLLERYGVQTLIQAVPLLVPHIPEIKVNIVGDGEYRSQLQKLVQDLRLDDYIHFTGLVPIEMIPGLISESDIGVVPILMHMQPTKLFEYVAMGKPVIASDFPAMRSCFGDGSVRYYKPGDVQELAHCILELYQAPEKRAAMASASMNIYQQYRWSTMKHEYLKVFNKLTNRTGPAVPEEK